MLSFIVCFAGPEPDWFRIFLLGLWKKKIPTLALHLGGDLNC